MRGRVRTGIVATAAVTAAVVLYVAATLPPPSIRLDGSIPPTHVVGAFHIHSVRSDGTGSVDQIADAASRAGLAFIVLTDHGDGTRPPDPPTYRHGVLTIDAVEVNTREGHLVALGLSEASPYPLAGRAADVIEDIHRQGGVVVVAHPDSPRTELSWRGGQGTVVDGVEWLNADSEWRDESVPTMVTGALHSLVRGPETVASLFSRPERSMRRWDAAARTRPTFGLAALDAHANIPWREQEEPRRTSGFRYPTYETMFRTLVETVVVPSPLTGEAETDASRLLEALVGGRSYATVRALAWPSVLEFDAWQGEVHYSMGERIASSTDPVRFRAHLPTAPGVRLTLLNNGEPKTAGQGSLSAENVTEPGVYRIEAHIPGAAVPWIVSSPIVIEGDAPAGGGRGGTGRGGRGGPGAPVGAVHPRAVAVDSERWTIEHDPTSEGNIQLEGDNLRFDYALGGGSARGQYAALVVSDDGEDGIETISFTASASSPIRLSVQVRLPGGRSQAGQRWRRSIYVDATPTRYVLPLQDFEPADRPTVRRPVVTPVESLLIVADTVNSLPGSSASVWVTDIELGVNRLE